ARPTDPVNGLSRRMLSMTSLTGHGSSRSATVTPTTARSASARLFQWGRTMSPILSPRAGDRDGAGAEVTLLRDENDDDDDEEQHSRGNDNRSGATRQFGVSGPGLIG